MGDEALQADRIATRTEVAKHREQTVIQFGWTMVYCRGWWCLGGKGKLRINYEGF